MFLTLMRGYVEYGAMPQESSSLIDNKNKVAKLIEHLDQKVTFAEDEQALVAPINDIRNIIHPNFYAITELEPIVIAEALLTRYEFQMFTKS